ncbi:MAG: ABC transporter ATP-binding protein [Thermodesulfobacteriota bacterium]|jgi:branched-chain amino acid transport system ATP-binding protein
MIQSKDSELLHVEGLTKSFDGLLAVSDFSLDLNRGELVGLIGPNGAGKTTVFNLMTGILRPDRGEVLFRGENLAGRSPHEISIKGLVRTFQNIRLMSGMTVRENLKPAFHHKLGYSLLSAMLHTAGFVKSETIVDNKIDSVLETLGISEQGDTEVGDLPYGIQRRVEIARALCLEPIILLLDEPTAGLNPREVNEIIEIIHYLSKETDIDLIVIEHNMRVIMSICERIVVINEGRVIAVGKPTEVQNNEEVVRVYLGERTVPAVGRQAR